MRERSVYKKALTLAVPMMIQNGITNAVSLVDNLMVGSLGRVFPSLYDTTEEVRHLGQWFIIITAVFFPIQGVLNVFYFTLRSGGKTVITFLFDSVFTWVIPIPAALLMCHFTSLPILGIYAIVQAADILKVVIGYILIQKGVWISNLVEEMQ